MYFMPQNFLPLIPKLISLLTTILLPPILIYLIGIRLYGLPKGLEAFESDIAESDQEKEEGYHRHIVYKRRQH
jgi:hypothetical protein